MASSQEISGEEYGNNAGSWHAIPLSEFKLSDLPKNYRSQRNWALIRTKAILVVKLVVTNAIKGSVHNGGGCITDLNSNNGGIELTVRTVAHQGYYQNKEARATLKLFINDNVVLQSRNVELKPTHTQHEIAMLRVMFDRNNLTLLNIDNLLTDIRNALRPTIYTLCEFVLRKYQTEKFTLPSFLENEVNCIKDIKFSSCRACDLEIQIQVEHSYVIDFILFMFGFASQPHVLRELLGERAAGSNINKGTPYSAVTVVSNEIFTEQFGILDKLLTSLYKPLTVQIIQEVNCHFSRIFPFEISCVLTKSNVMTMLVGFTSLSEQKSEEVGMETGQFTQLLVENMNAGKGKDKKNTVLDDSEQNSELQNDNVTFEIQIQEQDAEVTDEGLDANIMKEKQDFRVPCLNTTRSELEETATLKFQGTGYEKTKEEADLKLVTIKPQNKKPIKVSENEKTLAALTSYPYGNEPQFITLGCKNRFDGIEAFYSNKCFPGSCGGLVCLIPENPGAELKDIQFATHCRLRTHYDNFGHKGYVTRRIPVENEGVGVRFKFE